MAVEIAFDGSEGLVILSDGRGHFQYGDESRAPDECAVVNRAPVRCRYHCRACGGHFTSLKAFDAHRAGDHAANTRHCKSPLHGRLVRKGSYVAVPGVCRVAFDEAVGENVYVYIDERFALGVDEAV